MDAKYYAEALDGRFGGKLRSRLTSISCWPT